VQRAHEVVVFIILVCAFMGACEVNDMEAEALIFEAVE
jgi:hypothetical protein